MSNLEQTFTDKIDLAFSEYKSLCLSISENSKSKMGNATTDEEKAAILDEQNKLLDEALKEYSFKLKKLHREFMRATENESIDSESDQLKLLEKDLDNE